jgi:hypothetical protein
MRARATASLVQAAAVACAAGAAFAMGIRESKTELVRSTDGAALYEVRRDGPEGGGSLTYRVQGRSPRDRVDFLVSSDFSPGGPSQPQTVAPEICRQRIAALGAELAKRKIPRVTLHPEACASGDRAGVVSVAKPAAGAKP